MPKHQQAFLVQLVVVGWSEVSGRQSVAKRLGERHSGQSLHREGMRERHLAELQGARRLQVTFGPEQQVQLEEGGVTAGQTQRSTGERRHLPLPVSPVEEVLKAERDQNDKLEHVIAQRTGTEACCVDTTGDAVTDPFLLAAVVGLEAPASEGWDTEGATEVTGLATDAWVRLGEGALG